MKDIVFIVGSELDRPRIEPATALAEEKNLTFDLQVISAHRNLPELMEFMSGEGKSYRIFVAAAGLSAALPGVVASLTDKPVIGVPLVAGELNGIDALLSILQLPKGIPVATMGIGRQGLLNAVHLAERILKTAVN